MARRKFKITTSLGTSYVNPANDDEIVYKWKKSDNINYTLELSTKLIFRNDTKQGINDFTLLYDFEKNISTRCEDITVEIYKVCNGTDVLEFTGTMPLSSGEWDLDRCTVSLSLVPKNDIYDCINNNKKNVKVPVAECTPFASAIHAPPIIQIPDFYLYDHDGTDFIFLAIRRFTANSLVYDPQPFLGDPYEVQYPYGLFAHLCYRVIQVMLNECGYERGQEILRSDYFDWNAKGDTIGYIGSSIPKLPLTWDKYSYPNGGSFPGPTGGPGYYNRWLYLPRTPGINYYTGQTNKLTHLLFMPKSNANNVTASDWEYFFTPDGDFNSNAFSFEDIEKIWATMFQAYWFIDTDGAIRVEHISWFENNSALYDTTNSTNAPRNEANQKYKYKDELAPKKEIFLFSANRDKINGRVENYANQNNEILYDSICTNKDNTNNEKTYSLPQVTTDIKALDSKNDPDIAEFYDNSGINLFTCEFGVTYDKGQQLPYGWYGGNVDATNPSEVLRYSADLTAYPNAHIQWGNLIRWYLKSQRVLTQGVNGQDTITFDARTIKTKEQVPVLYQLCCNDTFEPRQALVRTSLGDGEIYEAEFNTKTNIVTIKTLHQ